MEFPRITAMIRRRHLHLDICLLSLSPSLSPARSPRVEKEGSDVGRLGIVTDRETQRQGTGRLGSLGFGSLIHGLPHSVSMCVSRFVYECRQSCSVLSTAYLHSCLDEHAWRFHVAEAPSEPSTELNCPRHFTSVLPTEYSLKSCSLLLSLPDDSHDSHDLIPSSCFSARSVQWHQQTTPPLVGFPGMSVLLLFCSFSFFSSFENHSIDSHSLIFSVSSSLNLLLTGHS